MRVSKAFIFMFILGCALKQENVKVLPPFKAYPETEIKRVEGIYHKVEKGETLYRLSKLYNVELSEIIKANRISDPSIIKEGQLIYIPGIQPRVKENTFTWPVRGIVVSKYGSITNRGKNKGIDIKASQDTTVKAAKHGLVCYAGEDIKGYGKVIILDHGDDIYTLYAYNSKLLVRKNDYVKQGEPIAQLDDQNPVLHFEIRSRYKALDPIELLK